MRSGMGDDRHLIAARRVQNEGVGLWQDGWALRARYKFWRAGVKHKLCWLETADFMAAQGQTPIGRDAQWRALKLAKSYYLRSLPQLASPRVYRAIAEQYRALSRLTCVPRAQQAYRHQFTSFMRLAQAACDQVDLMPAVQLAAGWGNTTGPVAPNIPVTPTPPPPGRQFWPLARAPSLASVTIVPRP